MIMHLAWSAGFWSELAAHALAKRVETPAIRVFAAPAE
jgi:hypothetical protein